MRKLAYIFGVALFFFGCAQLLYEKTSADVINENKDLIRKNPNDAHSHYILAFTYDRLGKYEKASRRTLSVSRN